MLIHPSVLLRQAVGVWVAFAVFHASSAVAQEAGVDYTRVLLPVVSPAPTPGLNGSAWVTMLSILNNNDVPVSVYPYRYTDTFCTGCGVPRMPPGITFSPDVGSDSTQQHGGFLFVDSRFINSIQITLRAHDLSRDATSFGTLLPIVRAASFRHDRISLTNLPATSTFRFTIRVYSLGSLTSASARIRVYGLHPEQKLAQIPDAKLGEVTLALTPPASPASFRPAYLELFGVDSFAPTQNFDFIRVDVEPLESGVLLWAFASVTNNTTQQVTIIEPVR